jgi:hypothetical protein
MGGDYYDRDVISSTTAFSSESANVVGVVSSTHPSMDPKNYTDEKLISECKDPIVFALDVTGSMGNWTRIIYDKMPMFYGQIMMQNYLSDPAISFCAIGDSTCDKAPLQVTNFGQGKQVDELISKMFLEGGGGGTDEESYELSAYFYQHHCELKNPEYPFFFVTGDEAFYKKITPNTIEKIMGKNLLKSELNSEKTWQELMKKFNVFLIKKPYKKSSNEVEIMKQWKHAIGEERVLLIHEPKACIDVMLGAIAITTGVRTMESYIDDMKTRGQSEERIDEVKKALAKYNEKLKKGEIKPIAYKSSTTVSKVELDLLAEHCEKLQLESLDVEERKYREELRNMRITLKDDLPKEYLCPLTHEVFLYPVLASDGHSYEKTAIELWLNSHDVSPLTGEKLDGQLIIPNNTLKELVAKYFQSFKEKIMI